MTAISPESPSDSSPSCDPNSIKIHSWPEASDPITGDTVLVRYMKLETFLLLLHGRSLTLETRTGTRAA
jgi:hypothetical protein